jgi:glyoxalase family protein
MTQKSQDLLSSNNRNKTENQKDVLGIHHVTAIASNPQKNIDFYTQILGLRLVKLTVNFDDPTTYHLYYGDETGRPGTILTFFPWADAPKGRRGTGQVIATSFLIPVNSIKYWIDRFRDQKIHFEGPIKRFGESEEVLTISDPDGLELEFVSNTSAEQAILGAWKDGPIPIEHAIKGLYSVTLCEEGYERTASVLTDDLGFQLTGQDGNRFRYQVIGNKDEGVYQGSNIVDLLCLPYTQPGFIGIGTVHHVAWRTPTDEQQLLLRRRMIRSGLNATPVIDRTYFHSVYFREPGGILFEIATNPPGFTIDERTEDLGTHLMLPKWLESVRKDLEKVLPRVSLPKGYKAN